VYKTLESARKTFMACIKQMTYHLLLHQKRIETDKMLCYSRSMEKLTALKLNLGDLCLPSGRTLQEACENIEDKKHDVLRTGVLMAVKELQKNGMFLDGFGNVLKEVVIGQPPAGVHSFKQGRPASSYILAEPMDAFPDRTEMAQEVVLHRSRRRILLPYMKNESEHLYATGYLEAVCTTKEFVSMIHEEKADGSNKERFERYISSPTLMFTLPSVLDTITTHRAPRPGPVDRHSRAFMDGMLDVSVRKETLDATSPVVITHQTTEQWRSYMDSRKQQGRPVRFYPYPICGKLKKSSGIASVDAETDHRYPIAIGYRSIITRQPGCHLTHAFNMYMDGMMLYRRKDVDDYQVCKALVGNSQTGKSTQIDLLTKLYMHHDAGNLSGTEKVFGLQDFTDDTKMAYAQEMGARMGISTCDLQSAIGHDDLQLAVKNGKARKLKWLIPIIMAGNKLGPWRDTASSMLRRLVMFVYCNSFTVESSDISRVLEEDIGPTILCIFSCYIDMLRNMRRHKFKDVFNEPAPIYFKRTRLEYGSHLSTSAKIIKDMWYNKEIVFEHGAKTPISTVISSVSAAYRKSRVENNRTGPMEDGPESFDDIIIGRCVEIFGLKVVDNEVHGLRFVRGKKTLMSDSRAYACSVMCLGTQKTPKTPVFLLKDIDTPTVWKASREKILYAKTVYQHSSDIYRKATGDSSRDEQVAAGDVEEVDLKEVLERIGDGDIPNLIRRTAREEEITHEMLAKLEVCFMSVVARNMYPKETRKADVARAKAVWNCTLSTPKAFDETKEKKTAYSVFGVVSRTGPMSLAETVVVL
jgi:hypothetical protein